MKEIVWDNNNRGELYDYFNRLNTDELLSNDVEMFGEAWGLLYPYHFMKETGLVDEGNIC